MFYRIIIIMFCKRVIKIFSRIIIIMFLLFRRIIVMSYIIIIIMFLKRVIIIDQVYEMNGSINLLTKYSIFFINPQYNVRVYNINSV